MPVIEWSDSFSINIKEMDEQHKKLIEIINALTEAVEKEKEREGIVNALEELINYTETHFRKEEELMNKYKYPDYSTHRALHSDLSKRVINLYIKYTKGDEDTALQLADLLTSWLLIHIADRDREYGKYLNARGVR